VSVERAHPARVIFAVTVPDAASLQEARRRVAALERFYAPLALGRASTRHDPGAGLLVGGIGREPEGGAEPLVWGEPLPRRLADANALIAADPSRLREIHGALSAIAVAGGRGRIVSAPSGPASLYESHSGHVSAWASHAVAAGWLAGGRPEIDTRAVPELLAFDFVGDGRTLLRDVRPVPPGTSIRVDSEGISIERWWTARERWERLPESEAAARAGAALLATLDARLSDQPAVHLALTGGVDSRVVAVALRQLGRPVTTFTWGERDWPDVDGARAVADLLGMPHHHEAPTWLGRHEAVAALDRQARLADGISALPAAEGRWPPGPGAVLGGMGGEIGRSFYYGPWPVYVSRGRPRDLAGPFNVRGRIAGAQAGAVEETGRRLGTWIEEAYAVAGPGWRALDVLYAEQLLGAVSASRGGDAGNGCVHAG
jgi:hypothetical protein